MKDNFKKYFVVGSIPLKMTLWELAINESKKLYHTLYIETQYT